MKDKHSNIEKYYCQHMLLKPKLTVINISICNVTDNISGLSINCQMQAYKENVSVMYLTLTILSLITSYQ